MGTLQFATCDRNRALGFLKAFYDNGKVEDKGIIKEVLDLVQADIIRIPDPALHQNGAILPSNNWDDARREEIIDTLTQMQNQLTTHR